MSRYGQIRMGKKLSKHILSSFSLISLDGCLKIKRVSNY